jgi:MtrB/PioB family decaheme-associated outer membrane protein
VNEFPLALDQRTNNVSTGVEWSRPRGMVRVAWDGSFFNNSNQVLVWDNPIRLNDFSNSTATPWDASGYSNGNGAAQGRMALWPSSTQHVIGSTGMLKLAKRTNLNGTLQYTNQRQNEQLIPWTINSVINNNIGPSLFPELAHLPRQTAEAEVNGVHALLNFNTRPVRNLSLQARYRYNDRDVTTPPFDAREYVRFDAVPEEIEEGISHQYDITRQNVDFSATYTLSRYGALRAGYGHEAFERHGRGFSDVGENTLRLSYDALNLGVFSVRAAVDVSRRRGEGFVEQGIDYEVGPAGTQPGLRYYDESDRDRTRSSLSVSANPNDFLGIYFQLAAGRDEYLSDESVPPGREFFGLLDADVTTWNIGVTATPRDTVSLGASYGRDDFSTLQNSRNANPPPDPQWTDPSRNWTLDNDEKVNNFNLWLELADIAGAAIRLDYDLSDSDNAFIHGGPRIDSLAAVGQFAALPNVTNTWHRLSADVKYFFTTRIGVGVGYYFEKLDITDFATIDTNGAVGFTTATGAPRIDYLGALISGYGNRPYDGQNVFVRLLYRF